MAGGKGHLRGDDVEVDGSGLIVVEGGPGGVEEKGGSWKRREDERR